MKQLTESELEKSWNDWKDLKSVLTQAPILKLLDLDKELVVRTYVLDVAIGSVLMQSSGRVKHPVAYASRKWTEMESIRLKRENV